MKRCLRRQWAVRTNRYLAVVWIGVVGLGGLPQYAFAEVLYDGMLGTSPSAQGWIYLTNPLLFPSVTQSISTDSTRVDSTVVIDEMAGFFTEVPSGLFSPHPDVPLLDRMAGFTVRWDARVHEETHNTEHRAGFSVIVTTQDLMSLELGFWEDQIWAQSDSPLFTHGEGIAFDTTASTTRYDLNVQGDTYRLLANGQEILANQLRDYTAFNDPFDFPYKTPSFLFFGDDTSSASADFEVARIEVIVPEPASALMTVVAGASLAVAKRRRRAN